MQNKPIYILFIKRMGWLWYIALFISSCGGLPDHHKSPTNVIPIKYEWQRDFNSTHMPGEIEMIQMHVWNDAHSLDQKFELNKDDVTIDLIDMPFSDSYCIAANAYNQNKQRIGNYSKCEISFRENNRSIDLSFQPVPVITNIQSGSTVYNGSLVFKVWGDPEHEYMIEAHRENESPNVLMDISTNQSSIELHSRTGVGELTPGNITSGEMTFTITDLANSLSSSITIMVMNGNASQLLPCIVGVTNNAYQHSWMSNMQLKKEK